MKQDLTQIFLEAALDAHRQFQKDPSLNDVLTRSALLHLRRNLALVLKTNSVLRPRSENQDVGTPIEFLRACREVFGEIVFDLAGSPTNHACRKYYGPPEYDSLDPATRWPHYKEVWLNRPQGHRTFERWAWLNPPYACVAPWVARCAEESERGRSIMVLVPASVGARWWQQWVDPYAYVLPLVGRLKFVGHRNVCPRDLALCLYSQVWSPQALAQKGVNLEALGLCPGFRTARRYLGPWEWQKVVKI